MGVDRVVIETENLTKEYGQVAAVKELNLTIKEGEIFGLLGPNGAGKTQYLNVDGQRNRCRSWARRPATPY